MAGRILKQLWLDPMPGSYIGDVINTCVEIIKMTEVEKIHFKFNDFNLTVGLSDTAESVARRYEESRIAYLKTHS